MQTCIVCTCRLNRRVARGYYRLNHHLTSLIINTIQYTLTPFVADMRSSCFTRLLSLFDCSSFRQTTVLSRPSHSSSLMTLQRRFHRVCCFENDPTIGSANKPHRGKKKHDGKLKRGTISSLNAHASEFIRLPLLVLRVFPIKQFEI